MAAADQALTTLEEAFAGFIALEVSERRSLSRMGGKSEQFCRQTLTLLGDNPQIVPASIGVGDAQADLLALDRLRPRLVRLQKLAERAEDSETALGSDIMSLALEGYALLKVAGRSQGLEGARKDLANRFYKGPRKPEPPATP
nr:hypothetical protein [Pseudoxanthomonas gei]